MGYGLGLYKVENPMDRASSLMGNAANSFTSMQKQTNSVTKTTAPPPSVGGAVSAGIGGAAAGAELAPFIGMSGGMGAGILAPLAIGAYLFS